MNATDNYVVIYDSSWPALKLTWDESLMLGEDEAAYKDGDITADDFTEMWGIHPDADFIVELDFSKE